MNNDGMIEKKIDFMVDVFALGLVVTEVLM